MAGELEVVAPQDFGLSVTRDPMSVLAEAKRAAKALTDIINGLPADKKVMMGGEQYIEFDHWQLVARFYGCTPKIVSTEQVQIGDARGFLSKAVVLDRDGRTISAAEAMCLNDEEKWSSRPKYEWHYAKKSGGTSAEDPGKDELVWVGNKPKKERIRVGEVAVPMNQLLSMSQTRAGAKALRQVFSWVVVLAGYAPTPAEELTGHEQPPPDPAKPPVQQPEKKAEPAAAKPGDLSKIGVVSAVQEIPVKTAEGTKTKFVVTSGAGDKFETWDQPAADKAMGFRDGESAVVFRYYNKPWDKRGVGLVDSFKLTGIEEAPGQTGQ